MPSSFLMYINLTKKQISNQVEDIVLINSIKCCDLQSFKYGLDKTVTLSKPD